MFSLLLFPLSSWCRSRRTWRWAFQTNVFSTSVIQELQSKFCSLEVSSSLLQLDFVLGCVDIGLLLCCRCRRCFFEEADGFPMHAWRFNLRFNVVRILWALPVIYQGRFGRLETHIIEVSFLRAQRGTEIHNPPLVKIHAGHWNTQWWYLYWRMI